jgi:hypothetical protein
MKSLIFKLFTIGLILAFPAFLGSCGKTPGPDEALRNFSSALVEKNWDNAWDALSYQSQKDFDEKVFQPCKANFTTTPDEKKELKHPLLGISVQDLLSMTAKEFFIINLEKTDVRTELLKTLSPDKLKIEKVTMNGNTANLKIEGRAQEITLLKEKGKWKVCLFTGQ